MRLDSSKSAASTQRLLDLAHECLSAVLQFDYLSSGSGHQLSAALREQRDKPLKTPRRAAAMSGRARGTAANADPAKPDESAAPVGIATEDRFDPATAAAAPDLVRQYLTEIATRRRLSSSQEYRLARAACDGDPLARQQLIEHQLGLVVMMARPYRNRGLPLLDLIEEGNLGLMQAIQKFDPERGCRFSTYAKWWIRQSMELALMTQTRVVHVPVYVTRALKRRAQARAPARTPDTALIPMSGPNAGAAHAVLRDTSRLLLYDASDQPETPSANADGEVKPLMDSLAAAEEEQPDLRLHRTDQQARLKAALDTLNEKEKLVIQLRFGLADEATATLESIAAQLRLSSERVRQIQLEALAKLRGSLGVKSGFAPQDLL